MKRIYNRDVCVFPTRDMIYGIDYQGFVYCWIDLQDGRQCIGSHRGHLSDGYTTSTGWCAKAISKRPHTFVRQILEFCHSERLKDLHALEQKWLDLIPDHELGKSYYNLKKKASGLSADICRKNALARWQDPVKRQAWIDSMQGKGRGRPSPFRGRKHRDETKEILRQQKLGNSNWNKRSEVSRLNHSERQRKVLTERWQCKTYRLQRSEQMKRFWADPAWAERQKARLKAGATKRRLG